jgi:MarR family transcriptional regulator, transcriptional regulator for hemolysin
MAHNHLKQHIGYWFNRIRMEVHQSFEARLDRYNITVAQWCILVALSDNQATSVGELADYIEVDKASISRVVERLVALELITHIPGKDRRSGFIALTERGKKLVPKLLREAELNEKQFFGNLTANELQQLQHIFRKIVFTLPFIQCDGWLQTPQKEVSMSQVQQIINTILKEGKAQQKPYPIIFEELKKAGVTSYAISWKSGYEGIYTGNFGIVHESMPAGFKPVTIAKECNIEAAKQALKEVSRDKINFVEWLTKMGAAGFSHYRVDILNRTVTYYNPSEKESFTEKVPTI